MTNDFTVPDEMKKEKRWCAWFYEEMSISNIHKRKKRECKIFCVNF